MNTEELLNILTCYHLRDFSSGTELIQALQEEDYSGEIKHSTFFDTVNDRGTEQLLAALKSLPSKIVLEYSQ
jgi:hypothetical protein